MMSANDMWNPTSEQMRVHIGLSLFTIVLCLGLFVQPARSQSHTMHDGMSMPMDEPMDAAAQAKMQAKLLADKKESEFNHHLAGVFVMIGGLFVFFQDALAKRWKAAGYVWPAMFLISGLFLLVWSDTELWPFGPRQWLEALRNNREVLQHKAFAILLLILGAIEWLRTSGRLKATWSAWVFPVLAIGGSVLLLFHEHQGGMHGANHMVVMARIKSEHLAFAMTGFGIALTKVGAESKMSWRGILGKVWPLLMVALGILLLFYRE